MANHSSVKTRVVSETVERYTIWDNFERHVQELRAIGVTDADIETLRAAATEVDVLEQQIAMDEGRNPVLDAGGLASIVSTHTCANGWVIQPPSVFARKYARLLGSKVLGGRAPDDSYGFISMVLVSLWALREYGDCDHLAVMQTAMSAERLSVLVMQLIESGVPDGQFDRLADDYLLLMGITAQKKKAEATERYNGMVTSIRTRLSTKTIDPS